MREAKRGRWLAGAAPSARIVRSRERKGPRAGLSHSRVPAGEEPRIASIRNRLHVPTHHRPPSIGRSDASIIRQTGAAIHSPCATEGRQPPRRRRMDPEDPKAGRSDPMREGRGNRERLHGSNPQAPELHAASKRQPQKEGFHHREPTEPHSSRMRHTFPAFLHTPTLRTNRATGRNRWAPSRRKKKKKGGGAGIPRLESFPREPDAPLHRRFVQNACRQVRFRERDRRFQVRYRHTSIREGCPRIEPRFACPHRTLRALRGRTIRRSHP